MPIEECKSIEFPKIHDPRGNLTFIESEKHVPFKIERVFYLYDVPGGSTRGGHAHVQMQQVLIAIAGSFDVVVDNGRKRERVSLNRSYVGLYIPPMVWREMDNFSSGAVCLVLASTRYDETDYLWDFDAFVAHTKALE